MTMSREAKASLVTAAITEDRTEIRLIRDRIYSITTFTTVGSFGITAFLLEKGAARIPLTYQINLLATCIDGALLLMLWTLCYRMMTDMRRGPIVA